MAHDGAARGPRPGPLAVLARPGSRRRYATAPPATSPGGAGWVRYDALAGSGSVRARVAADPVAGLGIAELTGSMGFHALAVPVVDLAVGLLVVGGPGIDLRPDGLWVRFDGHAAVAVAVDAGRLGGTPTAAGVADGLVALLDPVVAVVEPVDVELRWGAVADLVVVLALAAARAHQLDAATARAQADAVVARLRAVRPHPGSAPGSLSVAGPDGQPLLLAHRSTCCQWHRAARALEAATVADARCADCPSLDAATCATRLAALAAAGDLAEP